MKKPEPTVILKYLTGLRLWSLCALSVGLSAFLVWGGHIGEAIYSSVISAALYAFAGRDGVVQATQKHAEGKVGAAEAAAQVAPTGEVAVKDPPA